MKISLVMGNVGNDGEKKLWVAKNLLRCIIEMSDGTSETEEEDSAFV